ncbi:hypothetical protein [Streptosporangium sp. NPDC002524]|uniref:hypothetical protein n=1 Tax=Streptosporangium sp. NPDC002524 TaxID=3154537 RepID=UPI0033248504
MTRMILAIPPETARRLLRQSLTTVEARREASPGRHAEAREKREESGTDVSRHDRDREPADRQVDGRAGERAVGIIRCALLLRRSSWSPCSGTLAS